MTQNFKNKTIRNGLQSQTMCSEKLNPRKGEGENSLVRQPLEFRLGTAKRFLTFSVIGSDR